MFCLQLFQTPEVEYVPLNARQSHDRDARSNIPGQLVDGQKRGVTTLVVVEFKINVINLRETTGSSGVATGDLSNQVSQSQAVH